MHQLIGKMGQNLKEFLRSWAAEVKYTDIYNIHIIYILHIYINILYVQEVVTPFYIVSYYIKWVTTSWTYSTNISDNFPDYPVCTTIIYRWLWSILFYKR